MKTRRRVVPHRTSAEQSADVTVDGSDSGIGESADLAHDNGANGHEHLEGEPPVEVPSSHASTSITLPKRRRRLDETRVVASPPTRTEAESRTVIAPRARRTATVAPQPVVVQEVAEPRFTWRSLMTYENLFWVGLFTVAIVSRLWDIGDRKSVV